MQIKIFTIPVVADDKDMEKLNHFLRSNKVIDVRRELVQTRENSYWSFCVTYMPDCRTICAETGHFWWAHKVWRFTADLIESKDYDDWLYVWFDNNRVSLRDVISETSVCR